nr:hypothetical protein [uncultured Carboxylicivirga sp.]
MRSLNSTSIRFLQVVFFCLFTIVVTAQNSGDYRTLGAGGNWNNTNTWEVYDGSTWVNAPDYPGQLAVSGLVTILNGASVTLNVSPANVIGDLVVEGSFTTDGNDRIFTVDGDLTIAGSFNMRRCAPLTVTGATNVSGVLSDNNNNGSADFQGLFTVEMGGAFTTANNSPLTFQNGIVNNGTFERTGYGDLTFSGNSQSITGSPLKLNVSYFYIIDDITLDVTVGDFYINRDFQNNSNAAVALQMNSGSINLMLNGTQDFNTGGGTGLLILNDFNITGTGSKNMYGNIELTNDFVLNDGYSLNFNTSNFTVNGTSSIGGTLTDSNNNGSAVLKGLFTINSTGSYVTNNTSAHTFQNGIVNNGDLRIYNSGVTIDFATNSQAISGANPVTLDGTITIADGLAVTNNITDTTDGLILEGTLNGATAASTFINETFLSVRDVDGPMLTTGIFDVATDGNIVRYDLNSTQYITAVNYYDLIFLATGDQNKYLAGNTSVRHDFELVNRTDFMPAEFDFTVLGNSNIFGRIYDQQDAGTVIFEDVDLSNGEITGDHTGVFIINGDLTMPTAYGRIGRGDITVSGTTNVPAGLNLTLNNSDGTKIFRGKITIDGDWLNTSNESVEIQSGLEFNGATFTSGYGTYTFTTNDQSIEGSSAIVFSNDVFVGDNTTLNNVIAGGITINDKLDGLGVNAIFQNSSTVDFNDAYLVPMENGTLDCSTNPNTFNYMRAADEQYIKSTAYYNLILSDASRKRFIGAVEVLNDFSTSGAGNIDFNDKDFTLGGTHTIGSTGTFTTGSNTVTYNGLVDQQIMNIPYEGNLVLAGNGIKSSSYDISVAGDITVNNGSTLVISDNQTLMLADASTLTNNGTFKVVGSSGNPATVTTYGTGGYLINQNDASAVFNALYAVFDHSGGITISNGTVDATNNFSYSTFTNGTGTEYLNVSGLDPVGGLASVQSAVFESGPTYNVSRTSGTEVVNFIQSSGTLSGENSDNDNGNPGSLIEWLDPTLVYYSTGSGSAYATTRWAHNQDGTGGNPTLADLTNGTLTLVVRDGHTVTLNNGNIDVRKLIVGEGVSGEFLIGGDATQQTLTIQELLQVEAGARVIPSSEGEPAHIIKIYGNVINDGTINLYQSFTQVANVEIYGTTAISGLNTPIFNQLTFKNGCDATALLNLDINGNLILESGAIFNDGGFTHTVEYNWTNNGGTYNATGSLIFDGVTASVTASGTTTTFNDVSFSSGGLNTVRQDMVVDGNLLVSSNTQVSVGDVSVVVNGDYNIETGSIYAQANNYTRFNGSAAQSIVLDGTTSFDNISFANGGTNAKSISGDIVAGGILIIENGATLDGAGSHSIDGGFRVNGTCNLSGTITMHGGSLETSDPSVSAFTLGTANLIIDGGVNIRHTVNGSTVDVTVQNDVTVTGGYLVINNDATLIGQAGHTLTLEEGRPLYIRGVDNFPDGFGTYSFDPTAWVIYDADMDQIVRGGFTYGRLRTSHATKMVDGDLTITGYLDLDNSATLDLQSYNHLFSGTNIYNDNQNGSIDGSNATFTIGGIDADQNIQGTGTGSYVFKDLIISQNGATETRTKTFSTGCNLTITNDLTIENTGGTNAIQLIVDLNDNGISGPANNLNLGAYCRLNTDLENFGADVVDNFLGTRSLDVNSTLLYSLNGSQNIADGLTYGNLAFYGGDKIAEGSLDINGDITRLNGTPVFYDGGYSHTLAGNWNLANSDYYTQASATGTIIFDGVDQDINGYIFNNIDIANSGTADLFRDLVIYGNLTVEDGSSFEASALDMQIGGNILVNGSGVYSQSTGLTTLDGSVNQSITLSPTSTVGNLIIEKTNPAAQLVTLLSEMHVGHDLTIRRDAGILDISNQNLFIGDDFTVYDNTGITNLITTGSTITFNGSNAQYIRTYHEDNLVFNNLVFTGSGDKTFEYNDPSPELASRNFEVNGSFSINGSVVEARYITLYVRGDWTNNGTFNHNRTVYFDGADQDISTSGFYHVSFGGSGEKLLTGNISVAYDLYIADTANLNANGNNITVGRDWYNNIDGASFTHGNGKVIFNGSSYSNLYSGTAVGSTIGKTFYDVIVNKTANRVTLTGDLVVENNLIISSSELRTSSYDVYVAGDFDVAGSYVCSNSESLLTLNASGGTKIFNPNGATLRGLSIDAAGTTYNMQSDFLLAYVNMNLVAGTLDVHNNTIELNGSGREIDINGGALKVDSSSVIQFTNTQSIELNSGELYLVGKEGKTASLKNANSSRSFAVNCNGGTLYAQHYSLQNGSIVLNGSALDAVDNLSNGIFTEGTDVTAYIELSGYDLASDITLNGMIFNTGATYNVSRTSGFGTITLQDASGGLAGEIFEQDNGTPGTLVFWTFPAGFYWDGNGSAANTDWNDALNWDGNTVPGINDIVYLDHSNIVDAFNVVLFGTDGSCERLNINTQGSNAITMNVNSNTQLNVKEHVNIGIGATLSQTDATSIINIGKNWTNLGTYTPNTGKVIFNGEAGEYIISSGGVGVGKAFYDLEFNAGTSTYTIDNIMEVSHDLTITKGTFDLASPNNDVFVGGDWFIDQAAGGVFDASDADVTFNGTSQSITNGQFYNLIIDGGSTTTVNSNIAVDNTLFLNSGSALNALDNNIYVSNDWQNDGGTFVQTGFGTVLFNGTTNQSIDLGTSATTFNNISFLNSGNKYLEKDISITGDILVNEGSGVFNLRTNSITGVGTENTFTNNATIEIEGVDNFPAGFENLNFSSASNTRYWSDLDQNVTALTYGSISLRSLTDGVTSTKTALGDLVVTNDIYFTSSTRLAVLDLATNDVNVTLYDNIDIRPGSSINWGTGSSTLYHVGGNWNIDADITGFNNLVLEGSGDKRTYGDLMITGDLIIKGGIDLYMYGTDGRNDFKLITGSADKTLSMESGARLLNSRPASDGPAIPEGFGTYDFNENSTYFLYSDGIDQTLATDITYGNLSFRSEKNVTSDGLNDLDINGDWDINQSTYFDGGKNMNVAGANIYFNNYTVSDTSIVLILDGLRDQLLRDNVDNLIELPKIVFTGTGTKTLGEWNDVFNIEGDLVIDNDIKVTTGREITFNGANWVNNGIYTQTYNNLIFSGAGDQTIDAGTPNSLNYFNTIEFSGVSTKTFINNGADINNDFTIYEGTVDLGANDFTIYDEIDNTSGGILVSANANITLDGGSQTVNSPAFEINNIICSGNYTKYLASDWTINGDLLIESGVSLQTTSSNYNINIAGNWTNNGQFIDNAGKVTFDGSTGLVSIKTNEDNFYDVDFVPGSTVVYNLVSESNRFANNMYIGNNAELNLNGHTLYLGRNNTDAVTHIVDGILTVNADADLIVNNDNYQTTIDVNGRLNIVGSATTNVATLTSENTNNVNKTQVNINPGATMAARYYVIEYISDEGINLKSGSTLDAVNNFSDGTFLNMRDQQDARYLVMEANYAGGNISNVSFNYSGTPIQGRHYNVERKTAATEIYFENVTGALGSYKYEDDDQAVAFDSGLCRWPEVTETYWTGAVNSDWHNVGNWDNGVPTSLIDAIIPDRDNDPIIFNANAVCKSLQVTDGILRVESARTLTASEDVSVESGLFYINSSASTVYVGGDWTIGTYANFSHGDATVVFNSGAGYVQIIPGTSSFYNLEFDNASTVFEISDDELNIEGDLIIANGTLRPATNNAVYNLYGDYTIGNGTFDATGATNTTIVLAADADQTITNAIFNNLEVAGSGNKLFAGDVTVEGTTDVYSAIAAQPASAIDFKGDVTIDAAGTFNDGGESHTFSGANWVGDGAYTGTGTVTFDRTDGSQHLYNAAFNNLVVACTNQRLYLDGNVSISGDMTFEAGISYVNLQTNTFTSNGTGKFTVDDFVSVYVYGNDNFPKSFNTYALADSSYTRYYGSSDQNIEGVSYGFLVLDNENTKTLTGDIEVKTDLYFNESTLDVSNNNYSVTVGGNWNNNATTGGHFICHQGEVVFNNTENAYIRVGGGNTNQFYDLTIDGMARVSASNNLANDFVVNNNLYVTGGDFSASGRSIYVGGDLLASDLGGFTGNTGTYYLNKASGSAQIGTNGSSLLNVIINGGATYVVQNNLTANGNFSLLSGVFDGNGKEVNLGDNNDIITIDGTYKVGAGGILGIGNSSSLTVSATGRIEIVGTESAIAKVSNNESGGRYGFIVDGEIAAEYYFFEYMSNVGIYVTSSSTIDATHHFSHGTFSNGSSNGQLFRVENNQSFEGVNRLEDVLFPNNPGGSASNIAKYASGSGNIEIYNASGVFAGEQYDNDPGDLIDWTGPIVLTWNGSLNTDWNNVANWTASYGEPFIPDNETNVVIASTVNQPVLKVAGQQAGNLTINNGAEIRINTIAGDYQPDLNIDGDLIIDGSLRTMSVQDSVTVEGNWTVNNGGVVLLRGDVTFDGKGAALLIDNHNNDFYSLTFAGTSQYQITENTTIKNDFTIGSGAYFDVSPTDYSLTVNGNFVNNGTFYAQQGTVNLTATSGPKTLNAGSSDFYNLRVNAPGVTYNMTSNMGVSEDLQIQAGTLDVQNNTLQVGDGDATEELSISGVLLVNSGAVLDMGDGAALNVNSGGYIELLGADDANRATLTSSTAGRYSFDVNSGGSIKASYYTVDYTDADGLYMHPGANIDSEYDLSNGIFSNGYPGTGSYMTLLHEMGVARDTLRNLVFNEGPAYSVTRKSGTTVFFFEDASGAIGNYMYEKDDEVTPSPSSGLLRWPFVHLYTWEGDEDNNWLNAGNWFDDQLPVLSADVTIPVTGNDPVINISQLIEIHGLTIEPLATVTIQEGAKVTLNGDLDTNNGLIINSSVNNPTSIIVEGTVSGNTTINRSGMDRGYWWHIAHGVTGVDQADYDSSIGVNRYALNRHTDKWERVAGLNNIYGGNYSFSDPLEGYSLALADAGEVLTYDGLLNNDDSYSKTAMPRDWHHIANPYLAYIDVRSAGFDMGSFMKTIYIDSHDDLVVSYNINNGLGANGGSRYIAPGQAIWIRNYSASDFSISKSARVNTPSVSLKSASSSTNVLRLKINNSIATDETVIAFGDNGSIVFTNNDSEKKMNAGNVPNIFSIKGEKDVVINFLPSEEENITIPLGYFVSEDGLEDFTINASNIAEFNTDLSVYLQDKVDNVTIDLRETPQYTFTPSSVSDKERFNLILEVSSSDDGPATGIGETSLESVDILGSKMKAIVRLSSGLMQESDKVYEVYNIAGRLIENGEINAAETEIILPKANEFYIIKVYVGNGVYSQKIVSKR